MSIAALDSSPFPNAASPRISLVSASGKRMQPRLGLPLKVDFGDGRCCEAEDWSASGFSLPPAALAAAEGSIHRVEIHVPLAGCAVIVAADARVVRAEGVHARGFCFVGVAPEKARVIEHFARSGIDGEAAVVGGLALARAEAIDVAPAPRGAVWRNAAQVLKLGLLAAAVAGGVGVAGMRLGTVSADYAAVSAELRQIHAPVAGYLVSDSLGLGSRLLAGQRIGVIQPVADAQARLAAETRIASLETALRQQTLALDEAKAGFATFREASRTELDEAAASRRMLEAQVAAETRIFKRLAALKAKDVVGQQRLDAEEQALLSLQRALSAARVAEAAARQKLANAQAGRFTSDGRTTQRSPAELQAEIETARANLAGQRAVLAALDKPVSVVSPCDCTVSAVAATPGSFVLSGAPVADLAQAGGDGATVVEALVQNPRLSLLRQGQAVTVYLADRPDGVAGRVAAINFNPGSTGRIGLPDSLRTLADYGLLTVTLVDPSAAPPAGLPVTVTAPVEWTALAANFPLLRWGRSVFDGLAALAPAPDGGLSASTGKGDRPAAARPAEPA
jgi:multidrug resistance efflux pump